MSNFEMLLFTVRFVFFFFDEQNTKTHSIENNTQMESMKTVFLLLHKKKCKTKEQESSKLSVEHMTVEEYVAFCRSGTEMAKKRV